MDGDSNDAKNDGQKECRCFALVHIRGSLGLISNTERYFAARRGSFGLMMPQRMMKLAMAAAVEACYADGLGE